MKVLGIRCAGYMHGRGVNLQLPDRGIVTITGPNGRGKSCFVEAVAECWWGKTLRDDSGFLPGVAGELEVDADVGTAIRRCTAAGAKRLTLAGQQHDSSTKAQEAAVALAGDFDRWRRTHVFSSQDVSHFTLAADSARKELIEGIIGLEAFDRATAPCLSALSGVMMERAKIEGEVSRRSGAVDMLRLQLQRHRDAVRPTQKEQSSVDQLQAAFDDLRGQLNAALADAQHLPQLDIAGALALMIDKRQAVSQVMAEHGVLLSRIEQLADARQCPTCEQEVGVDLSQALRLQVQQIGERLVVLNAEHDAARAAHARVERDQQMLRQEAADRIRQLEQRVWEHESRLRAAEEQRRVDQAWEAEEKRLSLDLAEADQGMDDLRDKLLDCREQELVLQCARDCLGPRGARVKVLADALGSVQAVANDWLQRFFDEPVDLLLELGEDTRERGQRAGTVKLTIQGVGSGRYRSLSGGQRRRVDVALLFALAEVSGYASTRPLGTLFVDEAFDALDERGVEAVQRALIDISKERCVVLITHNRQLVEGLPTAARVEL